MNGITRTQRIVLSCCANGGKRSRFGERGSSGQCGRLSAVFGTSEYGRLSITGERAGLFRSLISTSCGKWERRGNIGRRTYSALI